MPDRSISHPQSLSSTAAAAAAQEERVPQAAARTETTHHSVAAAATQHQSPHHHPRASAAATAAQTGTFGRYSAHPPPPPPPQSGSSSSLAPFTPPAHVLSETHSSSHKLFLSFRARASTHRQGPSNSTYIRCWTHALVATANLNTGFSKSLVPKSCPSVAVTRIPSHFLPFY